MSLVKKTVLILLTSFIIILISTIATVYSQFNSYLERVYPTKNFYVNLPIYDLTNKKFYTKAVCLDNDVSFNVSKSAKNIISDNYSKNLTKVILEKELDKYLYQCNISLFNVKSVSSNKGYLVDKSPDTNLKLLPKDVKLTLVKDSNLNEVSENIYLLYNKLLNPSGITINTLTINGKIDKKPSTIILNSNHSSLSLNDIKEKIHIQVYKNKKIL
ncbi:hypothetical protein [Clostridium cylindrosporum]|uniref:Uncharacterized protein n=1 Tax=Clostridium cylindrosporum DSM 605 TaxID=1121307 RepID=A0A0J8DBD8_CLOCY|nr:hypothetical protein [Clostridium cylindrosporum]KMT21624.1 hypothetical protein CLCY_2c03860 [Clostridium cylindrosporum DSM 605]